MCKENKCEGTGCNGDGCGGECNGNGHHESEHDGLNRFIVTGYICVECDSDFGVNEFGMNIKDGIYSIVCPICGCPELRVYQMVRHSEHPFPSITMCKEVLDILREDPTFDFRVPNDGNHGYDYSKVQQDELFRDILEKVKTCKVQDYETCMRNNFDCTSCKDRISVNDPDPDIMTNDDMVNQIENFITDVLSCCKPCEQKHPEYIQTVEKIRKKIKNGDMAKDKRL
jgi:hypothetical protein